MNRHRFGTHSDPRAGLLTGPTRGSGSLRDGTAPGLCLVDPWARAHRYVEEHHAELDHAAGLVAPDVNARWQLDERVSGPVDVGLAVLRVVHGEGPGLHGDKRLARMRMPSGGRVRPERVLRDHRVHVRRCGEARAFGIEPAPITVGTTEPVGPVAIATPDRVSEAAKINAPMIQLLRLLIMYPSPLPV